MQLSLSAVLLSPSYKKMGFKALCEVPGQYRKWWIQNTRKYRFSDSKWMCFPHTVDCHFLSPHRLFSLLSSWLKLLSLNSLPQTVLCSEALSGCDRQSGAGSLLGTLWIASILTHRLCCVRKPYSLFSRWKLFIIDAHGLCVPKRPGACFVSCPAQQKKG